MQYTLSPAPWFTADENRIIDNAARIFVRQIGIDRFPEHQFRVAFGRENKGTNGQASWDGRRVLLNKLSLASTLLVFGHELTHVHQIARGDLVTLFNPPRRFWKGCLVPMILNYIAEDFGDAVYPWEREAYGTQQKKYYAMLAELSATDRAHVQRSEGDAQWVHQKEYPAITERIERTGEHLELVREMMATPFGLFIEAEYAAHLEAHGIDYSPARQWARQ